MCISVYLYLHNTVLNIANWNKMKQSCEIRCDIDGIAGDTDTIFVKISVTSNTSVCWPGMENIIT